MSESAKIPFYVEMDRIIDLLAKQIYQTPLTLLRENCQNAYDAILQRIHLKHNFTPKIEISVQANEIRVSDNGIGMTRNDLINHFWKAGSSGKNTPEARAAGVVGTFGIGAMANFGIANEIEVITESSLDGSRTISRAIRENLSATNDCIDILSEKSTGTPGTTIIARISKSMINVDSAVSYLSEIVAFLNIPVSVNGRILSQKNPLELFPKPSEGSEFKKVGISITNDLKGDLEISFWKTGEAWVYLCNLQHHNRPIEGFLLLRQNTHQIRTFRSRFPLAIAAVGSVYGFGGLVDLRFLEPTAGREALTTGSLQFLQTVISEIEKETSVNIAGTPLANNNTSFMQWGLNHQKFDLFSNLLVRVEPENRSLALDEICNLSKAAQFNYYEASDPSIITQYASEDQPLIVISTRTPRRTCELYYLKKFCNVKRISDSPTVLSRKSERDYTMAESAFSLRMIGILEFDYFVRAEVTFGIISHNLPILVDSSVTPIQIVLNGGTPSIAIILKLYSEDFTSLTGMTKDFVRNNIFSKISHLVPSSTRQGAEAFLKAMKRPRELFEYEKSDTSSFSGIWADYLEGKISLSEAAQQSTTLVKTNVQFVDRAATSTISKVVPDILNNAKILDEGGSSKESVDPLPAITRLDVESPAKLLTIEDSEDSLSGYRCFIAISEGVYKERGEFFLQPHRTEVIWGGQKALYIFQHHSGEFGLYYELQGADSFSNEPGGRAFQTCTIAIKNQIYIPVPPEIQNKFVPNDSGKKRFEIRCELLYQDRE